MLSLPNQSPFAYIQTSDREGYQSTCIIVIWLSHMSTYHQHVSPANVSSSPSTPTLYISCSQVSRRHKFPQSLLSIEVTNSKLIYSSFCPTKVRNWPIYECKMIYHLRRINDHWCQLFLSTRNFEIEIQLQYLKSQSIYST